ncbi:MAG: hypothetical protein AAGE52_39900 [Myxococcota bacterium]
MTPEWWAFRSGLKPALRLPLGTRESEAARALPHVVYGTFLYLADELAPLEKAARLESSASASERAQGCALLGRLLGYPECCQRRFLERLHRGVHQAANGEQAHEDFVAVEDALSHSGRCHARLAHLLRGGVAPLISHYPCRYDCPASLAYAAEVLKVYEKEEPSAARALVDAFGTGVAVDREGRRHPPERAPKDAAVVVFDAF